MSYFTHLECSVPCGGPLVDPSGILNAKGIKTNGAIENYTIEWERFGRRYSGGIRVTF